MIKVKTYTGQSLLRASILTLVLTQATSPAFAMAQSNCEMILGTQSQKVLEPVKTSRPTDLLSRFENGETTSQEKTLIREAMMTTLFGKIPVLFSLNHLLAYDDALISYGIHQPVAPSAMPKDVSKSDARKLWADERARYSQELKSFSIRIEQMTIEERKALARKITAFLVKANRSDRFVAPEDYIENPSSVPAGKNRLPKKQVVGLNDAYAKVKDAQSGIKLEALEIAVYESLVPLSKLAITDRLYDRVGGREAYQALGSEGAQIGEGLLLAAATAVSTYFISQHFPGHPGMFIVGGIATTGVSFFFGGCYAHLLITQAARIPETIRDSISGFRESLAKRKLWARFKSRTDADPTPEAPSKIIESELSNLNLESRSAETDWARQDRGLGQFGEELQNALGMVVETHMNLKFEEAEQVEAVAPLLSDLQGSKSSSEKVVKALTANKFNKLANELSRLDNQYFTGMQSIVRLKRDLKLIDRKLDEYIAFLDQLIRQSSEDEKMLLQHRRASLAQSKNFVEIQNSAMQLSEKNLMENLKTIEALRTLIMSSQSGMTIQTSTKIDQAVAKLSDVLQVEAIGESK
jgi:hypothetical protein